MAGVSEDHAKILAPDGRCRVVFDGTAESGEHDLSHLFVTVSDDDVPIAWVLRQHDDVRKAIVWVEQLRRRIGEDEFRHQMLVARINELDDQARNGGDLALQMLRLAAYERYRGACVALGVNPKRKPRAVRPLDTLTTSARLSRIKGLGLGFLVPKHGGKRDGAGRPSKSSATE